MPNDVFRPRMHGDVHAVLEWLEEQGRGPRVVDDDDRAMPVCDLRNGWNVLHFERLRTR
ncbi:hypothetical protein D9M72_319990 [compost metagenome]